MNAGHDATTARVGFVGLGNMGGAMASRIIGAGFATTLWARQPDTLAPFEGVRYQLAADLQSLGRSSDVVGICVFTDDDVREVVLSEGGILSGMSAGGSILIHATIGEDTVRALADAAAEKGVLVLDAPVSGGPSAALAGELAVMVGGDANAFERVRAVLQSYGGVVLRVGDLGAGQRAKVLNNVLTFCNLQTAYLALLMAPRLGLDVEAFARLLRVGGARSRALDELVDAIMLDPVRARHSVMMVEKDTRIFQGICASIGIERTTLDQLAEEAIASVAQFGKREPV